MVIGGIIIPSGSVNEFSQTMQKYRTEQKMFAELKWSKVTKGKESVYDMEFQFEEIKKAP